MDFNNCSSISNISGSVEQYLQHLQDKTNITMIPAAVMLIIFGITGLIGNTLVLVVYSQKFKLTPTKVLIMTIACFDLVANIAAIPVTIIIMFDTWNFRRPYLCKSIPSLGAFTAVGGAISLLIVAVVRYRKVCKPYGWQVTIRHAIISSTVAFIIAVIVAIPYVIIYGVRTRQTPCRKILGSECFTDDYYYSMIWPLLNNLVLVVIYLTLSVSLVVLYTLLGVTAWKHRTFHGASGSVPKVKTTDSSSPGVSSTDKDQAALTNEPPEKQHALSSKLIQTTQVDKGRVQALLCCTGHGEGGTTEENTQSSITLKTYITTDSEKEDNTDTTIPVLDLNVTKKSPFSIDTLVKASRSTCSEDTDCVIKYETIDQAEEFKKTHYKLSVERRNAPDESKINKDIQANSEQEVGSKKDQRKQNNNADKATTSKTQKSAKKTENRRPIGRVTAMLIIISAIFVLGFLPFLILTIFKNKFPVRYAAMDMIEQTFYNFFYRLYYLNSAANPIIYSLCDPNFRRQCVNVLTCRLRKRYL